MTAASDPNSTRAPQPASPAEPIVIARPRLPAAAGRVGPLDASTTRRRALADLFTLSLLSAVDGSLLALSALGSLDSLGGAATVGLTVVAGAGTWLAAHDAFRGRVQGRRDWAILGLLAIVTLAATMASVWVGTNLGRAVTLHVLPKAAGIVLFLVAAEVAGIRVPRPASLGRMPIPAVVLGAAFALELVLAWIP